MTNRRMSRSLLALAFVASCAPTADREAEEPTAALDEAVTTLDPEITAIVASADATRIANTIQTLVAFVTRNTCSSNTDPTTGIGAARDWLQTQYAALPGVSVTLEDFTM